MKNKSGQGTVFARHTSRLGANGKPQEKEFPLAIWERLPKVHQWNNGEKVELDKGGWVEVGPETGASAPEPLKKK